MYDCLIIGAGLSGLAAGIRLAHYGKKVCICERHHRPGGLNSYYSRGGYALETGLHAMTNYAVRKANKSLPLLKLLRQLRIPYESLKLRQQNYSQIHFPDTRIRFSNDFEEMIANIRDVFPDEVDGFLKLDSYLDEYNEVALSHTYTSAREAITEYISSPLLIDMLLCPLMYYGSAVEDDIDFSQFAIMYKSVYKEGFCRPGGQGIRELLQLLQDRFEESGGELLLRTEVTGLRCRDDQVTEILLNNGTSVVAANVLSSAGTFETMALCSRTESELPPTGQLGYVESIAILDDYLDNYNHEETITFFNTSASFQYRRPSGPISTASGVICLPHNFQFEKGDWVPDKSVRVTVLANYDKWNELPFDEYAALKQQTMNEIFRSASSLTGIPDIQKHAKLLDMMTPITIERFTGHKNGAIYGSPVKWRTGETPYSNLFVCGTDQGFLGIVGAMLSGISMANLHLMR